MCYARFVIFILVVLSYGSVSSFVVPLSGPRTTIRTNHFHRGGIVIPKAAKTSQQLGEFKPLNIDNDIVSTRNVHLMDLSSSDPIPFHTVWEMQKEMVQQHIDRLKVEFEQKLPETQFLSSKSYLQKDCVIMLQHKPVYTLGTASDSNYIKLDPQDLLSQGIDLVRIERGGEVTYHGPGQLTVYPILDLRGYNKDIHWYMRALEEAILLALEKAGVHGALREDDVTGVWVQNKKVAALGVKVKRWVTMHGLAVNVDERSLRNFQGIIPCGLEGREVACINDFLDTPITVKEFADYLKETLEIVFKMKLMDASTFL
jgi:lipoyl(octanoyl) transferase